MGIEDLSKEHLFAIANICTGGYFNAKDSSGRKEIETGGYGRRRQVEWIDYEGEKNYFEISGEAKDRGWHWYAWVIDSTGKKHNANCLNAPAVIDYCDTHGIDVRNTNS